MIKDILCLIAIQSSRDPAGPYAVSIAEQFGAHVSAVAFAFEPLFPRP